MSSVTVEGNDSNRSSKYRNDPFYLDTMVFEVEDNLYRVPRYGFEGRSGTPFEICATLPSNGDTEGRFDENPILLPVNKNDFESFLKVIYSPEKNHHGYVRNVFGMGPPTSKEEWLGVLHLSTMWCFDDIRQRAISELSRKGLADSEKVDLGLQFSVSDWVAQGYAGIASNLKIRVKDLDISQETKIALLTIREQFFSEELAELSRKARNYYDYDYSRHPPGQSLDDQAWNSHLDGEEVRDRLDSIVREAFSDTLASLR